MIQALTKIVLGAGLLALMALVLGMCAGCGGGESDDEPDRTTMPVQCAPTGCAK